MMRKHGGAGLTLYNYLAVDFQPLYFFALLKILNMRLFEASYFYVCNYIKMLKTRVIQAHV